jgi:hypothetical protein
MLRNSSFFILFKKHLLRIFFYQISFGFSDFLKELDSMQTFQCIHDFKQNLKRLETREGLKMFSFRKIIDQIMLKICFYTNVLIKLFKLILR